MHSPAYLDDAVFLVSQNPAPIIMFDTCSLLDIIRFPKIGCHKHRNIFLIHLLAKKEISNVNIIITRTVMDELNKHLDATQNETKTLLANIDKQHKELYNAMKSLPHVIMGTYPAQNPILLETLDIASKLRSLIEDVLNKAICLPNEKEVLTKAFHRVVLNKAPSKKGSSGPDCVIIETYLTFINKLREINFNKQAYFLTSNKRDFCDIQTKIHPDLAEDFERLQIIFSPELSHLPINMF